MPANSLVAKRSSRTKLKRNWDSVKRRVKLVNQRANVTQRGTPVKRSERAKFNSERNPPDQPRITPAQRIATIFGTNDDPDVLTVSEKVDLPGVSQNGLLLRRSTLKPIVKSSEASTIRQPDPIPEGIHTATKRIVRVVNIGKTQSLGVQVLPSTRSIGVKVGTPSEG